MKFNNILLIFALLLIVEASKVKFELANFSEISELQQTAYGKNLLETIMTTVKTGGNISKVKELLDELLFKLNKEQDKADLKWTSDINDLTESINKLKNQIDKLVTTILNLKAERNNFLKLEKGVIKNLSQYKKQLITNRKEIKDLKANRQKDKDNYKKAEDDHMDIINAVSVVTEELKKLIGSISGKNKPTTVEEISQEKRDKLYATFLEITKEDKEAAEFIEMATSADQDSLKTLMFLLNKLKLSAERSFNADKGAEKKSKKSYIHLLSFLKQDDKLLNKMITTAKRNLKKYKIKIVTLNFKIASKTNLKKSKLSGRKSKLKERDLKQIQYKHEKEERTSERKTIKKLQHIVKHRLESMSKYLSDKTN